MLEHFLIQWRLEIDQGNSKEAKLSKYEENNTNVYLDQMAKY